MAKRWVVSADSHVVEPDDLFTKALGKKWDVEKLPRIVKSYKGEKGPWLFAGKEYILLAGTLDVGDDAEMLKKANEDPSIRLQCLDKDGVWAEVLFATTTMLAMRSPDNLVARDCTRVFNDWMIEYCRQAPHRLYGAAMIHMDDPAWATKELKKVAKAGLRCAMINTDMRPEWKHAYQDKAYDKFWSVAQESGMPIMIHIVAGNKRDPFTTHGHEKKDIARYLIDLFTDGPITLANEFIFGGIMDRFPRLKVVLGEYELSWYPYWLFRAEQVADIFVPMIGGKKVKKSVRDYMKRVGQGVIDDPFASAGIDLIDVNTLMWGSDFPHPRCTYPNSLKLIDEKFGHLGPATVEKITVTNAARFYNIDLPKEMRMKAAAE
ncbi:MAG: amidohydrolase [Alphaproteobacteria bacterium]|nr:amidohydrolase [Alphaproteobacteria bacterium]